MYSSMFDDVMIDKLFYISRNKSNSLFIQGYLRANPDKFTEKFFNQVIF